MILTLDNYICHNILGSYSLNYERENKYNKSIKRKNIFYCIYGGKKYGDRC